MPNVPCPDCIERDKKEASEDKASRDHFVVLMERLVVATEKIASLIPNKAKTEYHYARLAEINNILKETPGRIDRKELMQERETLLKTL